MNAQDVSTVLGAYGLSGAANSGGGINWAYWVANILFGVIGMLAFGYGKKEKSFRPMMIGIVLMFYPWFVSNTILVFVVGIVLTAALFFWRE